ncbi:hypothetical protein KY308_00840 [Candidatus Woesearchaeota archaeon]|nr:hypothetical protein [Candidatus Woesearchaeota archaeon]
MKPKIKSVTNTEKMLWLRLTPSMQTVKLIHQILKKYDPYCWGLVSHESDFAPKYKDWINMYQYFFSNLECGYVIFTEPEIHLMLRKETKVFDKLKIEFMKNFEFASLLKSGKKPKNPPKSL